MAPSARWWWLRSHVVDLPVNRDFHVFFVPTGATAQLLGYVSSHLQKPRPSPAANPPADEPRPKETKFLSNLFHLARQRSSPVMAAAEARTAGGAGTGGPATTTSRFAAACGALSQYVRAAEAERMRTRHVASVRPLRLMPGADVDDRNDEPEAGPAPAAKLTIVYGGRALLLDDVPADRAAELLRLASAAARGCTGQIFSGADLPVARKVSLQRFMEKRKGRAVVACAEPYRRPGEGRDDLTLAL